MNVYVRRIEYPERGQPHLRGFRLQRAARVLAGMLLVSVVGTWLPTLVVRAQGTAPSISAPTDGEVIRGQLDITGTAGGTGFTAGELAFAYAGDPTDTWFTIQTLSVPVEDATLATWDTTTITDGRYVLRLRVEASDGTVRDTKVDVQIANYTNPEVGATVAPTTAPQVEIPTALLVPAVGTTAPQLAPTATPLPANPAAMSKGEIYGGLSRGAVVAVAIFLVLGAILLRRRA
jgi:hypothetical protein